MSRALPQFFDSDIEPKALCRNCEYYDGGGLLPNGDPREVTGDCLNVRSPRFQTQIDMACDQFFPCSTRWPDADHG